MLTLQEEQGQQGVIVVPPRFVWNYSGGEGEEVVHFPKNFVLSKKRLKKQNCARGAMGKNIEQVVSAIQVL